MNEDYDLTESKKSLGPLYPILKDKQGNVIDGFHRQNADPDWPSITVESVDDNVKLELARLAANFCRRDIPASELTQRITFLVKSGLKPEQIADQTGISKTTIYRHLPQDLKNEKISKGTSEAKQDLSAISRQGLPSDTLPLKTQDTLVGKCERCHCGTNEGKLWHGHLLCPTHYNCAENNKPAYEQWLQTVERAQKKLTPKTSEEKKDLKPSDFDTYEHKLGTMKVAHSEAELKFIQKLRERLRGKGYKVTNGTTICLVSTTTDFDIELPSGKIYRGFVDGQVHNGKQLDKDDYLRGLLKKHHPDEPVLPVKVETGSDKELEEKINEIDEGLKF